MRSILYGDYRIDFSGTSGGRVEQVGARPRSDALLRPRPYSRQPTPVPPGREPQAESAIRHLRDGVPVEFHAPCGFGTSTLLRHVAARAGAHFRVPAVYLPLSQGDGLDDALQRLVWALYTADQPVKLTTGECAELLRHSRAVIALDDVSLSPRQVTDLVRILDGCRILLGGTHPLLHRHGNSQALPGLPDAVAADVVAGVLGRPLDHAEHAAVARLAAAVGGQPLRLRQAAAMAAAGEHHLAELAELAERDPAELDRLSVDALAAPERRLLAVLAFTAGTLLPRDLLAAISDVARIDKALTGLYRRGLADQDEDRFGLPICQVDSYRRLLYHQFDLAAATRDLITYLSAGDPSGERSLSAVNAALALIRYAAERGQWTTVADLVRVAEPVLTLAGRWQTATEVLDLGRQAAHSIGDRASEALFAHQHGTLALCQDQQATAAEQLSHALQLRQQLGDHHGAQLSSHNQVLTTPPPPAGPLEVRPPSPPRGTGPTPPTPRLPTPPHRILKLPIRRLVAIIGLILALAAGGLATMEEPWGCIGPPTPTPSAGNTAPTVTIDSPADGEEIYLGDPVALRASSSDPDEPGGSLDCDNVEWKSSVSDDKLSVTDCEATVTFDTLGDRTITVTGTDQQDATGQDAVTVSVVNKPPR